MNYLIVFMAMVAVYMMTMWIRRGWRMYKLMRYFDR